MTSFADELLLTDEQMAAELGLELPPDADKAALESWIDAQLEQAASLEAQMRSNKDVAERRMQMIRHWLDNENGSLEHRIAWIRDRARSHLGGYDFGGKKSRRLPNGTFGYRKAPDRLEITDANMAIEFSVQHAIDVNIVTKPMAVKLKEYFTSTGEVPAGCELHEGSNEFFLSTAKE